MIETTLFDRRGDPVAYITAGFRETIFLWAGTPVAYLYEEEYIYGINGRHLGWFRNDVLFNNDGERIGFTFSTCPVGIAKEPVKGKKQPMDKIKPRWKAITYPKFGFNYADQDLKEFLAEGRSLPDSEESSVKNP